jgi:predicted nucleotidyltransferase
MAHRAELRQLVSRYGLSHPRVFGSVLSGTDTDESDLDLLVDATKTTTLFTLAGLEHAAQQLLARRARYGANARVSVSEIL